MVPLSKGGIVVGRQTIVPAVVLAPSVAEAGVVEIAPNLPMNRRAMSPQTTGDHGHRNTGGDHILDLTALRQINVRVVQSHASHRDPNHCKTTKVAFQSRMCRKLPI
jgi:hypothetical protein